MPKFTVRGWMTVSATVEVEADTPEQATERAHLDTATVIETGEPYNFEPDDDEAEEVYDDPACPTCGGTHPPCSMCGAPTRCPDDEPGEPFSFCDACDAELAHD